MKIAPEKAHNSNRWLREAEAAVVNIERRCIVQNAGGEHWFDHAKAVAIVDLAMRKFLSDNLIGEHGNDRQS